MEFRKTTLEDLERVMAIYGNAREFMARTGNPNQWVNGYPTEERVREDIAKGISYVAVENGEIQAVFVYFVGDDVTYHVIENGAWLNDAPYGVIHRVASAGLKKGAGSECIQWGVEQSGNLRIDTHADNSVMQSVLKRNGFTYCGVIYTEDGSPRVAFQKTK